MTTRRTFLAALICLSLVGAKEPPPDQKTYKYICKNDACKDKGRVYEYQENVPRVHYCPTCKRQLTRQK